MHDDVGRFGDHIGYPNGYGRPESLPEHLRNDWDYYIPDLAEGNTVTLSGMDDEWKTETPTLFGVFNEFLEKYGPDGVFLIGGPSEAT